MSAKGCVQLLAFVKLGRPQFLVGGMVFYALGAALAAVAGVSLDWRLYWWGQAVITTTQLMTHYSNDYFDFEADLANTTPTRWSGGSRVLPSGTIPRGVALTAALVLGALGLLSTLALAACTRSGPLVIPIALLMIVLSWSYSAPPLRLLARGLGELTTALVVTLLTPFLAFYLQRGAINPLPLLASVPLCGLQFAMLLTIELPDAAGDAAVHKRTLVVRWGAEYASRLCAIIIGVSFCVLPILVLLGLPRLVAIAAALLAPLGAWQSIRLVRGAFKDPTNWESIAFWSVALLFATGLAELAGALGVLVFPRM